MKVRLVLVACLTLFLVGVAMMPVTAAPPDFCLTHPTHPKCVTPSPTTPPPTTTTTPPPQPPTDKRIAVMLVNFSDDIRQPWSPAFIASRFNGPPRSVADFYARSSFGQFSVSADVFGWFVIAQTATPCNRANIASQADTAATASGVDLTAYTNRMYVFPTSFRDGECGSSAFLPGTISWVSLPTAACNESTGVCQERTFVHEFGHNLGMDHAGKRLCDGGVLAGTCTFNELGDTYDVMGCCPGSLLSNIHRLQMGWIPPSQVATLTTSQVVTVTPLNDPASLVYRIPYGTGYLYVENRAERTVYENGNGEAWPGGMLLFRIYPDFTAFLTVSEILDGSPFDGNSTTSLGLPVGASFQAGGVTITNLAFDGVNNRLEVLYSS